MNIRDIITNNLNQAKSDPLKQQPTSILTTDHVQDIIRNVEAKREAGAQYIVLETRPMEAQLKPHDITFYKSHDDALEYLDEKEENEYVLGDDPHPLYYQHIDKFLDNLKSANSIPTAVQEEILNIAVNRPVAEGVIFDYLQAKADLKQHQEAPTKQGNDAALNLQITTSNLKAVDISKQMLDKSEFTALSFKDALADRPDYKNGVENARQFKYAELPLSDLNQLGLTPKQVVEHPEIDKLLKGEKTNDTRLYIVEDVKIGLGINAFDAKLSLERKPDNSVSLLIYPELKAGIVLNTNNAKMKDVPVKIEPGLTFNYTGEQFEIYNVRPNPNGKVYYEPKGSRGDEQFNMPLSTFNEKISEGSISPVANKEVQNYNRSR